MFLPVGPENLTLRRMPVVTFAIMAGLTIFQFVGMFLPTPDVHGAMRDAAAYWERKPYLSVPDRFREIVFRNRYLFPGYAPDVPPEDGAVYEEQQRLLDKKVDHALETLDALPVRRIGLSPRYWDFSSLFTHMWLQSSLFALAGNLILLYIFAPYVEDLWGRPFFFGFYIITGVLSALFYSYLFPKVGVPLLGAGGSIGAVMGAFCLRFLREPLTIHLFLPGADDVHVPTWLVLPVWFVIQVINAIFWDGAMGYGEGSFTANAAGFVMGAGVAAFLQYGNLEKVVYQSPFDRLPEVEQFDARIHQAFAQNDKEKALALLETAYRKFPDDESFTRRFWEQAVRMGQVSRARNAGMTLFAHLLSVQDYEPAYFLLTEWRVGLPNESLPGKGLFQLVKGLTEKDAPELAEEVAEYAVKNSRDEGYLAKILDFVSLNRPGAYVDLLGIVMTRHGLSSSFIKKAARHHGKLLRQGFQTPEPTPEIELSAPIGPPQSTLDEDPFAGSAVTQLERIPIRIEQLNKDRMLLALSDGRTPFLALEKIKAVTVAEIEELGADPYFLLDLHTVHPMTSASKHRVLRTRSVDLDHLLKGNHDGRGFDRFDPILRTLLDGGEAEAFPHEDDLFGMRRRFASIAEMEREFYGLT